MIYVRSVMLAAAVLLPLRGPLAAPAFAQESSPPAEKSDTLSIATWGGAYAQAQDRAIFGPFKAEKNIKIDAATRDGTLGTVKRELAENAPWDVLDLNTEAARTLCKDGALEKIDPSTLASGADGSSAADDFLPGGLQDCAVASMAWSGALVYDGRAFEKAKPNDVADLLDLQQFPGKRVLPRGPRYTLELALLADGVAPNDVYAQLRTDAGVTRAFAALDKIKSNVIWWDKASEPIDKLGAREASMGLAFTGRTFRAAVTRQVPLGILWDSQIYDLDLWAIPTTARNKEQAKTFIAFATRPEKLAEQARLLPYGPMRKSAITLVDKHADVDVDMRTFLPTAEGRFDKALAFDGEFWTEREGDLKGKFETWLAAAPAEAKTETPAPATPAAEPSRPPPSAPTPPAETSAAPPAAAPTPPNESDAASPPAPSEPEKAETPSETKPEEPASPDEGKPEEGKPDEQEQAAPADTGPDDLRGAEGSPAAPEPSPAQSSGSSGKGDDGIQP